MTATVLDCQGLKCPLPIVHLALAIKDLPNGATVEIEATDPAFLPDLRAWSEVSGHAIERIDEGPVKRALVRKRVVR